MKILHILINEFDTVEELERGIIASTDGKAILARNKVTAEVLRAKMPVIVRVFWAEACKEYNNIILHETIID